LEEFAIGGKKVIEMSMSKTLRQLLLHASKHLKKKEEMDWCSTQYNWNTQKQKMERKSTCKYWKK
jgi:hypothetical protein